MNQIFYNLIYLLRPKQWYKNLVVFLGIIFSGNLLNGFLLERVVAAFFVVLLFSGVNYILNDLIDRKRDRLHPKKKFRPLASGKISVRVAVYYAIFLFVIASLISFNLGTMFFLMSQLFFLSDSFTVLFLKQFSSSI